MKRKTRNRTVPLRAKAAPRKSSRPKSAMAKPASATAASAPKSSRDKVRAYRKRMRTRGLRMVTRWVPDVRTSEFASEARRQCHLANASRYAASDQAWVDTMSDWTRA